MCSPPNHRKATNLNFTMSTSEDHPKVAGVINVIATLEDVLFQRGVKKKKEVTGAYKDSAFVKLRVEMLKRGVDECRQLVELNPKCEDRYADKLGESAANAFEECKRERVGQGAMELA